MSLLTRLIEASKSSSEFIRAKYLARTDRALIRDLVFWREQRKLSQTELAEIMGVSQQAVSKFERYDGDPKLSSIRRYANAVGVVVEHVVVDDAACQRSESQRSKFVDGSNVVYLRGSFTQSGSRGSARQVSGFAGSKRTDFALSA